MENYDGSLQMFVETDTQVDVEALRFHKWLYEHGTYDDDVDSKGN